MSWPQKARKTINLLSTALWWTYGHTYDGLLDFYPYQQLVKEVVFKINIAPGQSVLDLGCGTGNQLLQLAKVPNVQLVGVDGSKSMANVATSKLKSFDNARIETGDLVDFLTDQRSGSFDRIISTNVVYALTDRSEFWTELLRVLKPGGYAVIATAISTDSRPLIKEQLKSRGLIQTLKPRLLGVFVCDLLINVFGNSGHFEFPGEEIIRREVNAAGGLMSEVEPCYCGVDILFKVQRS